LQLQWQQWQHPQHKIRATSANYSPKRVENRTFSETSQKDGCGWKRTNILAFATP